MKLATSHMISDIDSFCAKRLGIPMLTLMRKSGEVIADTVRKKLPHGKNVVILAGKGNNGGDGYSCALLLMEEYDVTVFDVFSSGQKTAEGNAFLSRFKEMGGVVRNFASTDEIFEQIKKADCVIDAIFGTGFKGDIPEQLRPLAITLRETVGMYKIAVDVPLGINADNGSISDFAVPSSATVALSFIKPGIVSYPARSLVGEIIYSDLGIPKDTLEREFDFRHTLTDEEWVSENLPKREKNSNKGTFGKLLVITGSNKYRGAAHLSVEGALRSGVGLVTYLGTRELINDLSGKYPEVVYKCKKEDNDLSDEDIREITELSARHSATLIGSGSDNTEGLLKLTLALLCTEGGPLILDADAINALAGLSDGGILALKRARREVIITPHPLEFARLSLSSVADVQAHRLESAEKFSRENKVTVVLKGAGTITTGGGEVFINTSGSSALAKAGSGDVLAGVLSSIVAQGALGIASSCALAVYLHAVAGDNLAGEFSSYGVTPSDLPKEVARVISTVEKDF